MHSDVTKLRQVLLNFLSNASKFTEVASSRFRHPDRERPAQRLAVFRVTTPALACRGTSLPSCSSAFTQADASTTRKFGGTGPRACRSQAFSVMLGGDIAVESEPGKGTSFTVIVPANCPASDVEGQAAAARQASPRAG